MSPEHQDGPAGRDQQPLLGVVLCCTSILPEQRDHIGAAAQEMGAITKLDLTSDVTHLLVGETNTPKYKYVAKERPDIKVLDVAWLEAVRQCWVQDEQTDVTALDEQYRLPTFWRLNICITGFEDLQERNDMATSFTANGAVYHGDLTKAVTHLIAAAPTGKKYEYAGQWGIRIVAREWLVDSLARGMILDEGSYHPLRPPDERGRGAISHRRPPSPTLGKRMRDSVPQAGSRRKLRRTASSKLESQNDDIWADMGTGETGSFTRPGAEWDERPHSASQKFSDPQVQDSMFAKADKEFDDKSRGESNPTDPETIFGGLNIHISGFDNRQTSILEKHLTAGAATLYSREDLVKRKSPTDANDTHDETSSRIIILVPSTVKQQALSELKAAVSFSAEHDHIMTDWWVEKCVFDKKKVSLDTPLCRPIANYPIKYFEKLLICPTSISGMDLLHFSKAAKLLGARYDESLRPETSVLVCGGSLPNPEKLKYAMAKGISIVSCLWLWACVSSGKVEDFTQYLLIGSQTGKGGSAVEPQRRSTPSDADTRRPKINMSDSPASKGRQEPLQDVTSQTNSQQKSSPTQRAQPVQTRTSPTLEEAIGDRAANCSKENSADTENANVVDEKTKEVTSPAAHASPAPVVSKINDVLAHIKARRQERTNTDPAAPASRRHRPLGRAVSNPSSLGAGVLSCAGSSGSLQPPPDVEEEEDDLAPASRARDVPTMFRPSQALSYENEDSAAAREKLLKQSGAMLRDIGGMKRVESIGVAVDVDASDSMNTDRAAGKRRPARKR